jgi:hypothetical protein
LALSLGGFLERRECVAHFAAQIDNAFTYHPPKPGQPEKYSAIRAKAKELAELIAAECPPSRETSLALTNVEQAVMWANAAVARNE